jgi:hypothetical protein
MGRSGTPLRRGYSSAAARESRREPQSLDNPCVVARNESGRRFERARLSRHRKSARKLRQLLKSKKVRRRSVVKVKARITAEDDSTAKSTVRISS